MTSFPFPRIATVVQKFDQQHLTNVDSAVQAEIQRNADLVKSMASKRLAVCVGSRGIAEIPSIVRSLVAQLRKAGAEPFIVPAMGSHGGGTAKGQMRILADYGITESNVGAPLIASMETVEIGSTEDGVPVHLDRAAYESDGIVLVNRVKPHTDFKGKAESGLMKMVAVGLGNIEGASHMHRFTPSLGYERLIITKAEILFATGKVLMGLAVIENAYHEPAHLELIKAGDIVAREQELLVRAKELMPGLPAPRIDLLIIDQIGKNISGTGLDPNVTGRWFGFNSLWQEKPDIDRIAILDLSEETHGNAVGLGLADFCTQRLVDKMDQKATYLNALTAHFTVPAKIPMHFSTDEETLRRALRSLDGSSPPQDKRVIRIRDTLNLTTVQASESLLPDLGTHPNVVEIGELRPFLFLPDGSISPW